jgi:hypothetical protein
MGVTMSSKRTVDTIIPAEQGYSIAEFVENPDELIYTPIIAWFVQAVATENSDEVETKVHPISLDNSFEINDVSEWDILIRCPDGRLVKPGHTIYDTEAEAIPVMKERAATDEKRRERHWRRRETIQGLLNMPPANKEV